MLRFRSLLFTLLLSSAAVYAEPYSPEVEAMLRPLPEKAVMMGNLVMTVDEGVQAAVQAQMDALMAEENKEEVYLTNPETGVTRTATHRHWGSAIVMNAATGQLLALVRKSDQEADFDLSFSPAFMPGATFVPLAAAAALDKGILTLDSEVDAATFTIEEENGDACALIAPEGAPARMLLVCRPPGFQPILIAPEGAPARMSVREALTAGNEPAAARIALACGPALYQSTLEAFGLADPTGIGIQGDSACDIEDLEEVPGQNSLVLATMGAGTDCVRVSLLQLASVYATLANGGERITPRVIQGLRLNDGVRMLPTLPAEHRRVVSAETAAVLCSVLNNRTLSANTCDTGWDMDETEAPDFFDHIFVRIMHQGDTPYVIAVILHAYATHEKDVAKDMADVILPLLKRNN